MSSKFSVKQHIESVKLTLSLSAPRWWKVSIINSVSTEIDLKICPLRDGASSQDWQKGPQSKTSNELFLFSIDNFEVNQVMFINLPLTTTTLLGLYPRIKEGWWRTLKTTQLRLLIIAEEAKARAVNLSCFDLWLHISSHLATCKSWLEIWIFSLM